MFDTFKITRGQLDSLQILTNKLRDCAIESPREYYAEGGEEAKIEIDRMIEGIGLHAIPDSHFETVSEERSKEFYGYLNHFFPMPDFKYIVLAKELLKALATDPEPEKSKFDFDIPARAGKSKRHISDTELKAMLCFLYLGGFIEPGSCFFDTWKITEEGIIKGKGGSLLPVEAEKLDDTTRPSLLRANESPRPDTMEEERA